MRQGCQLGISFVDKAVRIKTVFFLESRSNNNNHNSDSSMAVNCDTENWCDLGMMTARWKQARQARTLKRRQQDNNNNNKCPTY